MAALLPNVISDKCTFYWDIRIIPKSSLENILNEFDAYCKELEKELQTRFAGAKIITSEDHPPVPPLDTPERSRIVPQFRKHPGTPN